MERVFADLNLFPCFGVPAQAWLPFLNRKSTKPSQLNAVPCCQAACYAAKNRIHQQRSLSKLKVRVFSIRMAISSDRVMEPPAD